MIKEHVKDGVVRITLDSRRWYYFEDRDIYKPSITWILEAFPKDRFFYQYLASLPSWEYGQQVLNDAGDQGSRVHWGIEQLVQGLPLHYIDIPFGYSDHFTPKEWEMIISFTNWFEKYTPAVLAIEQTVEGEDYAGTVDLVCRIGSEDWLVDWKTAKSGIYDSYKCQVAAYAKALDIPNTMIVRLGSKHKVGYEVWTNHDKDAETLEYYYDLFRHTKAIWQHLNPDPHPRFYEAPEEINLILLEREEENVA